MDVTEENLATLANYLQQTLNPDQNIRRPGWFCYYCDLTITYFNDI